MPDERRYEAALAAAQTIIRAVGHQTMPEHEKLARVTYAILDAIRQAEQPRS